MAVTTMRNISVMIWQIEGGQRVANVHYQLQLHPPVKRHRFS
jgi:hypothetical protein